MIDTLFVNGCSWTDGYLLEEEPEVLEYAQRLGYNISAMQTTKNGELIPFPKFEIYNKFNWAGYIAEQLSIPNIVNFSTGAGSNSRIVRTTISYLKELSVEQRKSTFVIIGWTIPDRNEIYLDDKLGHRSWEKFNLTQTFDFLVTRPGLDEKFIDKIQNFQNQYIVDVHNDYARMFDFFQQSYLLANLLENLGVQYYFFNSFPVEWSRYQIGSFTPEFKQDMDIYHSYNAHSIDDDFFFFLDRRKDMKVHLSDGHPNCKGYKLWADHILDNMQQRGIIQ